MISTAVIDDRSMARRGLLCQNCDTKMRGDDGTWLGRSSLNVIERL